MPDKKTDPSGARRSDWTAPSDAPFAETHRKVWIAIDTIADRQELSPSALARIAGLDATAFNPSKRISKDGRLRWPSVETLAKVMSVSDTDFHRFAQMVEGDRSRSFRQDLPIRTIINGKDANTGRFAAATTAVEDRDAFWLEIETTLANLSGGAYREGDRLLISPNAELQPFQRVAVGMADGSVRVGFVIEMARDALVLEPLQGGTPKRCRFDQMAWSGRILWASQ
ncbi:MAG: hypothetical protein AAFW46_12860 [Pseudomonadota bacterium]